MGRGMGRRRVGGGVGRGGVVRVKITRELYWYFLLSFSLKSVSLRNLLV